MDPSKALYFRYKAEHKEERLHLIENHHLHMVRCEKTKKESIQSAEEEA